MGLPILTYHSLDETGSPVSVSPAMFRRHLAALERAGYTVLPLGEALERDERVVALTFDDGYAAVYEQALPLLASYGWRATVFAVSDYVGRDNAWPGQPPFVPPGRLLSWEALRELVSLGWEVGAHSRTHPDLTALGDDALADEILGGKARLEDQLGREVKVFAYPYGSEDQRVRARVAAVHTAACTTRMGIARRSGDRYALERLDMWYFSRPTTDRLLGSRWMGPYATLCRAARLGRANVRRVGRSLRFHTSADQ